jgi:chromosome segregation ATPase
MNASISELKSSNSPNRLEHDYLKGEVDNIKAMGDLKIISYKLDEYDKMFAELKTLVQQLAPLAADLEFIKGELNKLKDKEIVIPEIDLSGIEGALGKLDKDVSSLSGSLQSFESRLKQLERKKSGGRF